MHVAIEAACSGSPPQCSTFSSIKVLRCQEIRIGLAFVGRVGPRMSNSKMSNARMSNISVHVPRMSNALIN